jgi:hypothetical protein
MNDPQMLAAKKLQMANANASGRSSTNLTTSPTIAGGGAPTYSGTTLAQR